MCVQLPNWMFHTLTALVLSADDKRSVYLYFTEKKMEKLRDRFSSRQLVVEDLLKYTDELCGTQSRCNAVEDMRPEFVKSLPSRVGESAFIDVIVDRSVESFCRVSGGCCPEESVIVTQQISRGIVYTERELIVEARDESGHPYRCGGEEVTAKMLDCFMKEWFPTYDTVDKARKWVIWLKHDHIIVVAMSCMSTFAPCS